MTGDSTDVAFSPNATNIGNPTLAFPVSVSVQSGSGSYTISPDSTTLFDIGSTVSITAVADSMYAFDHFEVNGVETFVSPMQVLISGALSVSVHFVEAFQQPHSIIINEVLADPDSDPINGDANGDGVRNSVHDEFVELVNMSSDTVDMTVGGAISGIGVHFNIHDVGFFHESVVDMDVLLSDGKIVTCSSTQNKELFNSIPNTYGTIGKILRAKLKIEKTKPYVKVNVIKFNNITDFIKQMKKLSDSNKYTNICSLVYGKNELYIIVSNYVDKYKNLVTFTKYNTFYKYIKTHNEFYVKTRENMFIFESDWYWNIPDSKLLKFILPKSLRCMKFFKNIAGLGNNSSKNKHNINAFIQDWEVEYEKSFEFLTEMFDYMKNSKFKV